MFCFSFYFVVYRSRWIKIFMKHPPSLFAITVRPIRWIFGQQSQFVYYQRESCGAVQTATPRLHGHCIRNAPLLPSALYMYIVQQPPPLDAGTHSFVMVRRRYVARCSLIDCSLMVLPGLRRPSGLLCCGRVCQRLTVTSLNLHLRQRRNSLTTCLSPRNPSSVRQTALAAVYLERGKAFNEIYLTVFFVRHPNATASKWDRYSHLIASTSRWKP